MECKDPLTEAETPRFKKLAALIVDDDTLARLLAQSSLENRNTFYQSVLAYLPFKPKPYWWHAQRARRLSANTQNDSASDSQQA